MGGADATANLVSVLLGLSDATVHTKTTYAIAYTSYLSLLFQSCSEAVRHWFVQTTALCGPALMRHVLWAATQVAGTNCKVPLTTGHVTCVSHTALIAYCVAALPCSLMQLVYEKEKRLRMMMKMHGLGDGAYWMVTYSWFYALYVVYMFIFILFGSLIGLNMFRKNSYGKLTHQATYTCGVGRRS